MRIKYIGNKPEKADNVAVTGLKWTPGQVHEVADLEACRKLLAHSGVWAIEDPAEEARLQADREAAARLEREREQAELEARQKAEAEAKERAAAAERETAAKAEAEREAAAKAQAEADERARQSASVTGLSSAKAPGAMDLDELKTFCTAKGVKFHPNISKDKLLERLQAHAEGAQS